MDIQEDEFYFGDRNDRIKKSLKKYGKTLNDLEQDVKILREWVQSQHHLPEIPSKFFNIFHTNFSVIN